MTFHEAGKRCRFGVSPTIRIWLNTYVGEENEVIHGTLMYWWTEGLVIAREHGGTEAIPETIIQEVEILWTGSQKDEMGFGNYDFDESGITMEFGVVHYLSRAKRLRENEWAVAANKSWDPVMSGAAMKWNHIAEEDWIR